MKNIFITLSNTTQELEKLVEKFPEVMKPPQFSENEQILYSYVKSYRDQFQYVLAVTMESTILKKNRKLYKH